MLLQLIENGVAVYSPHTSFDSAEVGINQQLAVAFGLTDIRPIRPHPERPNLGSGRIGSRPSSVAMAEFLEICKVAVRADYLEYSAVPGAEVRNVAVACGAAAEMLNDAVEAGCDAFVTGEARFHTVLEARERRIPLILLGHYSSERPAVEYLAQDLADQFDNIRVFASVAERDPLTVFVS
jgi:putative NIF3 family GTP cyclohydrolase 1 type 2